MGTQSLGIKILFGLEIVISLRILLFTIPVIISRWMQKVFSAGYIDDWMILVATVVAFFYLVVGFSSMFGHRLWKVFHYMAAFVTVMLTYGFLKLIANTYETPTIFHMLPSVIALGVACIVAMSGRKKAVSGE
ncbi:hypothetical protein MNBD_BACTEROID05-714 [hydrothermal vent metagenome]|uniref:Uncharacterized protein n=1 Tax=hydrothermal vent metagenome TaxID=652676 RepID=A0A3B0UHS2_9ZZZZ